tara:strand:- start:315 stop:1250 length:936 start_codon:yes stop_codon:yes gene_type:complete
MVNVFGESTEYKRHKYDDEGPIKKRCRDGENSGYYAQYFQHLKTTWDIDFEPSFWIDGYDVQKKPFKVLNKYDNEYDAVPSLENKRESPTMGLDPFSQRKTLAFDGNQFLTCPMDWSTNDGYIDNLQVFIVFKYKNLPKTKEFRGGLFGNDNGGYKRFVAIQNGNLAISGTTDGVYLIKKMPRHNDPVHSKNFCVLSVHWNNTALSNFGENKSSVWCNGKQIGLFTAQKRPPGYTSFALGAINPTGLDCMEGEIGRLLVCGSREHPIADKDIEVVHKYLLWEWNIQVKGITPKRDEGGSTSGGGDSGSGML